MKKENENVQWESEYNAIQLLCDKWKCSHTYLGKDMFSRVDGFLHKENELKGIYEVKCRTQGLSWFNDYKSTMISYAKIQIGSDLSRLLKAPFFVIIQTGDKHLITFQITDTEGRIVCPMNVRYQQAEKTPNFEKKATTNAYLTIDDGNGFCKIIKNDIL